MFDMLPDGITYRDVEALISGVASLDQIGRVLLAAIDNSHFRLQLAASLMPEPEWRELTDTVRTNLGEQIHPILARLAREVHGIGEKGIG